MNSSRVRGASVLMSGRSEFVALSLTVSYVSTLALMVATPPIVVCDPVFVAEMPGS